MGAKGQVKRERRIERRSQPAIHKVKVQSWSTYATPVLIEPPQSWVDRYADMDAAEMAVALGIDNARRQLSRARVERNGQLFDDEDRPAVRKLKQQRREPDVPEEPIATVDGIAFHVAVERARAAGRCVYTLGQIDELLAQEHRPVNLHEIQRRNMRK